MSDSQNDIQAPCGDCGEIGTYDKAVLNEGSIPACDACYEQVFGKPLLSDEDLAKVGAAAMKVAMQLLGHRG